MTTDNDLATEPELQHEKHCPHPQRECACSRAHLVAEARRLREQILTAEATITRLLLALKYVSICEGNCRNCRTWATEAIDRAAELYPVSRIDYQRAELPDELLAESARVRPKFRPTPDIESGPDLWSAFWPRRELFDGHRWFAGLAALVGPLDIDKANWRHPELEVMVAMITDAFSQIPSIGDVEVRLLAGEIIQLPDTNTRLTVRELLSRLGHYTSTYCQHELHTKCRHECKMVEWGFCEEHCNCYCHREAVSDTGVEPDRG